VYNNEKRRVAMKTNDLYDAVKRGEVSANSKISVNVFNGPIGGYGFRKGFWDIFIDGVHFKMYSCIPHSLSLAEQKKMLIADAKKAIENCTETYIDMWGSESLRYNKSIERVC
jgi:hypothetical protein